MVKDNMKNEKEEILILIKEAISILKELNKKTKSLRWSICKLKIKANSIKSRVLLYFDMIDLNATTFQDNYSTILRFKRKKESLESFIKFNKLAIDVIGTK